MGLCFYPPPPPYLPHPPTVVLHRTDTSPYGPAAACGSASRSLPEAFRGSEDVNESRRRLPRGSRQPRPAAATPWFLQAHRRAHPRHADSGASRRPSAVCSAATPEPGPRLWPTSVTGCRSRLCCRSVPSSLRCLGSETESRNLASSTLRMKPPGYAPGQPRLAPRTQPPRPGSGASRLRCEACVTL